MGQRIKQAKKRFRSSIRRRRSRMPSNRAQCRRAWDTYHLPVNFSPPMVFPGIFAALLALLHPEDRSRTYAVVKTGRSIALLVRLRARKTDAGLRYLPGGLPGLRGPDIPIINRNQWSQSPGARNSDRAQDRASHRRGKRPADRIRPNPWCIGCGRHSG